MSLRTRQGGRGSTALAAPRPGPLRRRLIRPLTVAVLVGVLVLLGGAGYVLGFTSLVPARSVEVVGVEGSAAQEASRAADVPLGGPLFRVDTGRAHVGAESLRWVREVDVSRSWTSGAVVLDVTPREPAVVLRDPQGRLEVADADGVAYRQLDDVEAVPEVAEAGLPVVDVPTDPARPTDVAAAVAFWDGLPDDVREQVTRVRMLASGDLQLRLGSGVQVVWGQAGQVDAKARILASLLEQPEVEQAPDPAQVQIDLSVPGTPVLRGGAVLEPED